jgi:hypothetical protein
MKELPPSRNIFYKNSKKMISGVFASQLFAFFPFDAGIVFISEK